MTAMLGSLLVSHELGICKNYGCNKWFERTTESRDLGLYRTNLSSVASQRDFWSLRLSANVHRPISYAPYRFTRFKCYSFLDPSRAFQVSALKNTALAITRSYNAFQGSAFILKLAPAVGVIVFALWGLSPLIHQSINIFHQKGENSWRRSSIYYVMTSYLQPLLLWTGATLICRALDPMVLPSEASQIVKQRLLNFIRSLSTVLALAYCLSSAIQQAQKYFMETNNSSDPRNMGFQFAGKAVYTAVWVAAVSLFMELLGFSTQKWLTAGGLGTVLLTLAGREIFTNFLSSAMIHATRPFVVNEWIQTKIEGYEVSGTVEHVGWWSPTIIRGEDREAVHIPNHKFTVNVVRNLTQKTHWRIKTHLAISHLDVNKINNIVADMRKVLAKNPQVEHKRLHRRVFLDNVNTENQALLILISCFVKTSHFEEYLCVKEAILLDLLRVISHHHARLATPIRTVQKIYNDADLENIPFTDSVFARGGAAPNRPLLLIEPHYKINGDDRTKSQTRSARTNGEQDSKAAPRPNPDGKTDAKASMTPASDSKAKEIDSKAKETPTSDSGPTKIPTLNKKADAKVEVPNPDTRGHDVTATQPRSGTKTDPKRDEVPSSNSRTLGVNLNQNLSNKQQPKKTTLANDRQNSAIQSAPIPLSETVGEKPENPPFISQSKQESEKIPQTPVPRPPLEENIVLGVALEGSKRTLPIEDEMVPSPLGDVEMAATRNENSSPISVKEKVEGQLPILTSTTSSNNGISKGD